MAARTISIPLPNGSRIPLVRALPFALIHILAIGIFFVHFRWSYLMVCLALAAVRMFFVTAGYHRYFAHRSYKTSRMFQFLMAFLAMTSSQKGVLWWAGHHRHHHRHADHELDQHSPTLCGFFGRTSVGLFPINMMLRRFNTSATLRNFPNCAG